MEAVIVKELRKSYNILKNRQKGYFKKITSDDFIL